MRRGRTPVRRDTHTHTDTLTYSNERMRHTKPVSCRNIRAASSRLPPRQYKGLKSEDSNRLHIFCASQTTISDYASDVNTNVTCAHRHTPPQSASRTDNYLFPKRFIASYRGPDPEGDKSGRGSEASASPARALVVMRLGSLIQ